MFHNLIMYHFISKEANLLIDPSVVRDAEHFKSRIGKLDGGAALGDYILAIAQEKKVITPRGGSSSAAASESTGTSTPDGS